MIQKDETPKGHTHTFPEANGLEKPRNRWNSQLLKIKTPFKVVTFGTGRNMKSKLVGIRK